MRRGAVRRGAVRRSPAAVLAALALLTASVVTGCSDPDAARPIATPLAAVQSGTVRVGLHQVMVLTLDHAESYTAQVADPTVVSVVAHRDAAHGRFEPELVPLRAGSTQVALTGSEPGEVVGFRVVVTAAPTTQALPAP